jgi:hypothetical protein
MRGDAAECGRTLDLAEQNAGDEEGGIIDDDGAEERNGGGCYLDMEW